MDKQGVIYILTNPSFPDYVKIGYADDMKMRLAQLNKSECTPFAFRVYATYEVSTRLTDKRLHDIIDKLNPDLRAIDTVDGKKRIREFYAMSAEDAYAIFEAMAEIHGTKDKLKLSVPTRTEKREAAIAADVQCVAAERRGKFSFEKLGIPVGAELVFVRNPSIICRVADNTRKVVYDGEEISLSALAKKLLNKKSQLHGTSYFSYNGMILADLLDD